MPVLRLPSLPAASSKHFSAKQEWGNLPAAALSLAIAEAATAAKRFTLLLTADSQSAEDLDFISNAELQLVLMKHGFVHDEESGILVKELTKRELAVDALYRFLDRVTFGSVSRHFGL